MTQGDKLLVVIPVKGHQQVTDQLLVDVRREGDLVDVLIVDNGGDFLGGGSEVVVSPGMNVGWAGACNVGLRMLEAQKAVVLLNNDTRLSPLFFQGLLLAWNDTNAGMVAPTYDDVWAPQRCEFSGPAGEYVAKRLHRTIPAVDGTCMFLPRSTVKRVGAFETKAFGPHSWGAEMDYALRLRQAGLSVCCTELSYLNHQRGVTARQEDPWWEESARKAFLAGMARKWGENWRERFYAPIEEFPKAGQTPKYVK